MQDNPDVVLKEVTRQGCGYSRHQDTFRARAGGISVSTSSGVPGDLRVRRTVMVILV